MLFKKSLKKLTSFAVAVAIFGGMTISDVEAANKAINIPSKSAFKHTAIIGNNRADTSNIIISNSKETNNFILVNQYSGLSYALMNSANAAKTGSYIVPVNDGSIPKEHQYFSASDESVMNLKLSGNSSSFKGSFINDLSGTYANVEKNISNNLSRASVDNLNNNFSSASTVFIVNGDKGLADAMSIAPVSYRDKTPILFTTKDGNKIDGYSKKSGVNYVVVGGNKVVSDSLVKEYNATRLAGDTRYETNKAVLDRYYPNRDIAYFTNGDTLVDALSSVHMTKDDGIVLVNHKKNHNLISNIDTYQIGGVAGYEFKYKNENGKFAGVSKVSAKKKTPVNNAATRYKVYKHKININNVTGSHISFPNNDLKILVEACLNQKTVINLNWERMNDAYFTLVNSWSAPSIDTYRQGDKCYVYGDESIKNLKEYSRKLTKYRNEINRALSSMNLNCSNDEMIRQINQYICDTYSYKVIGGNSFDMTENYEGQCMHYSLLFNNMCAAVGIDMDYVEGDTIRGRHGWNRGTFDGHTYYFDITWNDPLGTDTFREDYLWCEKNPHLSVNKVLDDSCIGF
ncbi:cell wall-binding repeat-containing protein [Peptacetobacter hiranonis]|uniref:cell wall-binding repeat-containing protein n=1 Tax=Peptacetobacter hiranonis TaxID=89152 RepID=UPI0022DF906F|nr:cell wall-binding repeat-containing protein [Peptacetobacter hiranonis]